MIRWLKILRYSFVFTLLIVTSAFGQEDDYTQYYLNLPGVNPGFTGMDDFLDLKTGLREGWNSFGVKNNNTYISAYRTINSTSRSGHRNNSLRLSNPNLFNEVLADKKFRRRHGLGGMITNRTVGPYRSFGVGMNYSYHLPISRKLTVSLGTRAGYTNQRIDFINLNVRNEINDLFYQSLLRSGQGTQNSLLIDFGTVLYSNRFFLGLSTSNGITKKMNGDQLFEMNDEPSFKVQTSVIFPLNSEFDLFPGLISTYSNSHDLIWLTNLRLRYKKLVYLGTAYGSEKMSLLFGLSTTNLTVNYAYDMYTSNENNFNINTHELVMGLTLFNKHKLRPRFW